MIGPILLILMPVLNLRKNTPISYSDKTQCFYCNLVALSKSLGIERIFINNKRDSAYSRGLWKKCENPKEMGKLNVFFVSHNTIKFRILGDGPIEPVTYVTDFKNMFSDIDIDNM